SQSESVLIFSFEFLNHLIRFRVPDFFLDNDVAATADNLDHLSTFTAFNKSKTDSKVGYGVCCIQNDVIIINNIWNGSFHLAQRNTPLFTQIGIEHLEQITHGFTQLGVIEIQDLAWCFT